MISPRHHPGSNLLQVKHSPMENLWKGFNNILCTTLRMILQFAEMRSAVTQILQSAEKSLKKNLGAKRLNKDSIG